MCGLRWEKESLLLENEWYRFFFLFLIFPHFPPISFAYLFTQSFLPSGNDKHVIKEYKVHFDRFPGIQEIECTLQYDLTPG